MLEVAISSPGLSSGSAEIGMKDKTIIVDGKQEGYNISEGRGELDLTFAKYQAER